MNKPEYYHGKSKSEESTTDTYVEVCEPHCITTIKITDWKDGSRTVSYGDEPFKGSLLGEIQLACRGSNFNVYKDARQTAWNHYTDLLKRTDHATRFETRKARNA